MSLQPVTAQHVIANCQPGEAYGVVVDFERYPRIFKEISASRILNRVDNKVRAEFRLQLVLPIRYVLDLVCDPAAHAVDWTFVEGEIVTGNQGGWRFSAQGADTKVDYRVALSVSAPVPGFVLRKVTDGLVSLSLPGMFRALEREVRSRQA